MERKIKQWVDCNPLAMSKMSTNAIIFAFEDAKKDIIEMAKILDAIAYPRRGSKDEEMTLQDFANLIQSKYTMNDLSI